MILKQNEIDVITELQTQEKNCVEKYRRYKEQAKDEELKNLFGEIEQLEQKHYDTLGQVLNGDVPCCDCNDSRGKDYAPTATYSTAGDSEDKQADNFLVTDCIGTEKMVSSEYNTNVFLLWRTFSSLNCLQIFRSRNRIMQRCYINTKQ